MPGGMMSAGMMSSGDDAGSVEWGTPQGLFAPAHDLYDFTLDGAASHANALLPRYCTAEGTFGPDGPCICGDLFPSHYDTCPHRFPLVETEVGPRRLLDERDGLAFPWAGERVFLNPPWGDMLPAFTRKARDEFLRQGVLTYCVLPSRTDTGWMQDNVFPWARYRFPRGRTKFIDPHAASRAEAGLPARTGPPVGLCIAVYR